MSNYNLMSKNKIMYRFLTFLLFLLNFSVLQAQTDSLTLKKTNEIISAIKNKCVPDKRTVVFNVKVQDNPFVLNVESNLPEAVAELRSALAKENVKVQIQDDLLPSKNLDGKIYGVANLSVCNNRYEPDQAAEMATQMLLGTPVKVLKKQKGHYLVQTPDGYIAWVESAGIGLMDETAFKKWQAADKVVFTEIYGHAYQQPDLTALPVSDLVSGNILQLLGQQKGFYKVAYPDGRIGYVEKQRAQDFKKWLARPNPNAEQILKTAKTLIGVPYLWGGTSIKGVDCSGLTKTSYFLNGIILPRDASQQALVGEPVDIFEGDSVSIQKCLKNLRAGDLLFFSSGKNKSLNAKVTHTALYIGDGEFIQSAGLVRLSSMLPESKNYDDFQSRTLVAAHRMLTAIGKPQVTRVDQHPFYVKMP